MTLQYRAVRARLFIYPKLDQSWLFTDRSALVIKHCFKVCRLVYNGAIENGAWSTEEMWNVVLRLIWLTCSAVFSFYKTYRLVDLFLNSVMPCLLYSVKHEAKLLIIFLIKFSINRDTCMVKDAHVKYSSHMKYFLQKCMCLFSYLNHIMQVFVRLNCGHKP